MPFSITKQYIVTIEHGETPTIKVTHSSGRLDTREQLAIEAFAGAMFPNDVTIIVDDSLTAHGREKIGRLGVQ